MRSITFLNSLNQTITLDLIETIEGLGSAPTVIQEQKAPYQDGTTWIDTLFDVRQLTVTCVMTGITTLLARDQRKDVLLSVLNPKLGVGVLTYTYDNGARELNCSVEASPIFPNKLYTDARQRYQVTFRAHNPYFIDPNTNLIAMDTESALFEVPDATGGIDMLTAGIEIAVDLSAPVTVVNTGQVDAPVQITFYGPATNPKVENQTTGEYIKLNKTLIAGDVVEINTAFGEKTVTITNGVTVTNGMAYLDLASTFWSLAQGDNLVRFTDDASTTTARCQLTYKNRYLGA